MTRIEDKGVETKVGEMLIKLCWNTKLRF